MKINEAVIVTFVSALLLVVSFSYGADDLPPPLPTAQPQSGSVICSPSFQIVARGEPANFSANGGSSYSWYAAGGNRVTGSGRTFSTAYSITGIKRVVVGSAGQYANCTVSVAASRQITTNQSTSNQSTANQTTTNQTPPPPPPPPPPIQQPPPLPGTTPTQTQPISQAYMSRIVSSLDDLELKTNQIAIKADAMSAFFKKEGDLDGAGRYSTAATILREIGQNARETEAFISTKRSDPGAVRQAVQSLVKFVRTKVGEARDALTAPEAKPCKVTGCSGEVCSGENVITTCEIRPEYSCFRTARCERQSNGRCDWTQTPDLAACIGQRITEKSVMIEEGKTQTITLAGRPYTLSLGLIVSTDKIFLTVNGVTDSFLHSEPKQILDISVRIDDISLTEAGKYAVVAISLAG